MAFTVCVRAQWLRRRDNTNEYELQRQFMVCAWEERRVAGVGGWWWRCLCMRVLCACACVRVAVERAGPIDTPARS